MNASAEREGSVAKVPATVPKADLKGTEVTDGSVEPSRPADASATKPEPLRVRLTQRCWFCLKTQREVKKIVEANTGARICDECVGQCIEIMGLWGTP